MTSALSVVPGKGWALFDLLIYQDGVLVLPMDLPMPDRAVNAKSRGWQERRLSAVAGLSRSALSERPGAVFFPFGTTTITVGLGPYRSVTLTPTTGESMRLRKTDFTIDIACGWDALRSATPRAVS